MSLFVSVAIYFNAKNTIKFICHMKHFVIKKTNNHVEIFDILYGLTFPQTKRKIQNCLSFHILTNKSFPKGTEEKNIKDLARFFTQKIVFFYKNDSLKCLLYFTIQN